MTEDSQVQDPDDQIRQVLGDYSLRFRTLAEKTTFGLFQVLPEDDGLILSVNMVMALMLGYTRPEDLVGLRSGEFFINKVDFDDLIRDIEQEGSVAGREIRLRQKGGYEIWVSMQAWKLGIPKTLVIEGIVENITEDRVFEQEMQYHESELNRYALALAQANKKLNLLSSITRHDLLNKLTGLMGYLELMKDEFPDPRFAEYFANQSDIIRTITLQIQFTKDYQDIGIDTPQWFDLNRTIRTAMSSLPLQMISLTVATENLQVYGDPMLEKVFYNLIENSLRHGGTLSRISISAEILGDSARIVYEDDGVGVPERFKEAIFLRKHFKHTGFGLFLSREILGITGLTIRECGLPGRGARFEIQIPPGHFRIGDDIQ